jgi:neutral ceramidase
MLVIGAASQVINNDIGTVIQGASVDNTVKSIRDDLEANALLVRDGEEAVLLVSCDVGALLSEYVAGFRRTMAEAAGVPERNIIIACSHTHAGPSVLPTSYFKEVDEAYYQRLDGWLGEVAAVAAANARAARVTWGRGQARIGYNRRVCWSDGTHTMHRPGDRDDFIGLEGPDDPEQIALFAVDTDDALIAVLHNNTAHPTSFYGADFLSADYPGAARSHLREVLGQVPVLFLNGAFGDISNTRQDASEVRIETAEQRMQRQAHLMAGETLRLLHEASFHEEPRLGHLYEELELEVQLPDGEKLAASRELLQRVEAGDELPAWETMLAHGRVLLQDDFGDDPVDTVAVHAVRLGDLGIILQPTELFCQFGLDIKRRSPAPLTAIASVAEGYVSYCPTTAGIIGGGYSGEPLWWTRLAPGAGERIVDTACRLLGRLWKD